MDPVTWLATKYNLSLHGRLPIEIPNAGRTDLARWCHVFGYQTGAEIGVERGLYSEELCQHNPGVRLYCIDSWKAYHGYRDHVSQEKLDGFYEETQTRLLPYPRAVIFRDFSAIAADRFQDGELDFVYLDGNHALEYVIADLAAWTPKVRAGGMIAGHDFVKYKLPNQIQVVPAVRAWTEAKEIEPWFLVGLQTKDGSQVRDTARSWCWFQPQPLPSRASERPIKQ